jgi:hypothetical protein
MAKPRARQVAYGHKTQVMYWTVYGPRKGAIGIIRGLGWTLEDAYKAWRMNYVNVQLY